MDSIDFTCHATEITEANGVTLTRGYNPAIGLATSLSASNGSATLAEYTYTWDGFGNLKTRHDGTEQAPAAGATGTWRVFKTLCHARQPYRLM